MFATGIKNDAYSFEISLGTISDRRAECFYWRRESGIILIEDQK